MAQRAAAITVDGPQSGGDGRVCITRGSDGRQRQRESREAGSGTLADDLDADGCLDAPAG